MILLVILAAALPVAFEASAQQGVRARNAPGLAQINLNQKRMRIELLVRKVGEAADGHALAVEQHTTAAVEVVESASATLSLADTTTPTPSPSRFDAGAPAATSASTCVEPKTVAPEA